MQHWQSIKVGRPMMHATSAIMVVRMVQLLGLCITNGNLDACPAVFRVVVTRAEGSLDAQFADIYRPLVPQLRELLAKHTLDFCSPPFKDFLRFLIEQCLHNVGLKPAPTPAMRRIGCGCQICGALDAFMLSNSTTKEFPGPRNQGQHLEQRISGASDIVTSSRSRPNGNNKNKSFTVVVTKRTENPALTQWDARQKGAESFLSSIGNSDVIAKIMGSRVVDVRMALTGVAVFAVDPSIAGMFRSQRPTTTATTTTTTATAISAKNTTLPTVGPTNPRGTPMLGARNISVGSKRKRDGEP
jgi:hypothetical protein